MTLPAALPVQDDPYVAALARMAQAARSAGDYRLFWSCANRLVALDGGRSGSLFLLRAEACAHLGALDLSRQDVLAAFRVEPDLPGLAERVLLLLPEGGERWKALVHRLRAQAEPTPPLLDAVVASGHDALVRAACVGGQLVGRLWWRGGAAPALTLHYGAGAEPVPLEPAQHHPGSALATTASFAMAWPASALHASLQAAGALIVPEALASPVPPRQTASAQASEPALMVLVPAFAHWPSLSRCIGSVLAQLEDGQRLLVVDDASPDPEVQAGLARLPPRVMRLRNGRNLGFAGAVNAGLALRAPGEDVLLLNSDATLPPGALRRLSRAARSAPDIASVTPLSNNGEDVSVPRRFLPAPEPDDALLEKLDRAAAAANGEALVPLTNGIGFCLYVPSRALERLGGLSGAFERGYFEDVEFCLRAGRAGLRNLCATGVYVAHAGSLSFGSERQAYVRRNLARLKALYPDYEEQARTAFASDPLRGAARAMTLAYLAQNAMPRVLVAPAACPAACALAIAGDFAPNLLLRPGAGGWRVQTLDPAYASALDHPAHDLSGLLPWLAQARLGVIQPDRLGEPWRDALSRYSLETIDSVPDAPGLSALPPVEVVALAAPEADEAVLAALGRLEAAHPLTRFILIDDVAAGTEATFLRPERLLVAGTVAPPALAAFAQMAGVGACAFFPERGGAFDPRRAAARAAGLALCDLTLA